MPKEKGEIFRVTQQIEKLRAIVVPGTIEEISRIAEEASSIYLMEKDQSMNSDNTLPPNTERNLIFNKTDRRLTPKKEEGIQITGVEKHDLLGLLNQGESADGQYNCQLADFIERELGTQLESKRKEDRTNFLKGLCLKPKNSNTRFTNAYDDENCPSTKIKRTFECLNDKTQFSTRKSRNSKILELLMKTLPKPTAPQVYDFCNGKEEQSKKGSYTHKRQILADTESKHDDLTVLEKVNRHSKNPLRETRGSKNTCYWIRCHNKSDRGEKPNGLFTAEQQKESIRLFIENLQQSEEMIQLKTLSVHGNLSQFISQTIQLFLIHSAESRRPNIESPGTYPSLFKRQPTAEGGTTFKSLSKVSTKKLENIFPGCSFGYKFNKKIRYISQRVDSSERNKARIFHLDQGRDSRLSSEQFRSPKILRTSRNKDEADIVHSKIFFSGKPRQAPVYFRGGLEGNKFQPGANHRLTEPEIDSLSNLSKINEFSQTKEIIIENAQSIKSISRLEKGNPEHPYFINISARKRSASSRKGQKATEMNCGEVNLEKILVRLAKNTRKIESDIDLLRSLVREKSSGSHKCRLTLKAGEKDLKDFWSMLEKQFTEYTSS